MRIQSVLLILLTIFLLADFIVVTIGNLSTIKIYGYTITSLKPAIPYWTTWYAISQNYVYFIVIYIPLIIMYSKPSVKLFFGSLIGLELIAFLLVLNGVI